MTAGRLDLYVDAILWLLQRMRRAGKALDTVLAVIGCGLCMGGSRSITDNFFHAWQH
jgi:hypothetical protein